ncbi:MAG: aminopeptidase P family N-terminal domain-containing protein, partial [Bacteroidales bacterium]|nr:aminopeptidase P family N-terminal domain-containing protein [Bacteroidales bacterium]
MNIHLKRVKALRRAMKDEGLDVCIVPVTDPHLGEYVPPHWKIIEWLTGFTGSAATVVVTKNFAGLWTDSRYFIQAEQQLDGSGFELVKLRIPHTPEYIGWLADNMKRGAKVGVDGRVLSIGLLKQMQSAFEVKKIEVKSGIDIITGLWTDRPPMPSSVAFEHDIAYAGITRAGKIGSIRNK